ncbi:MAG: phosphatidylglycerophosphatase A [Syntrophorhabdaceae bacterium]|nr:phosphatidylglycerophosphatase A [Syntrophorhabdaceae bacterium]
MGTGQVNRFQENRRLQWWLCAVASGFGVGRVPFAPGTAGTLLCLPIWYWTGGKGAAHFFALALVLLISVPAIKEAVKRAGQSDPGTVVIDEIAGMLVAATCIPWNWKNVLAVFLLFRFFDMCKFGPMAWLDSKKEPFYVLADDVAAGICAGLVWRGVMWLTG